MLTDEMIKLIRDHSGGMVASINDDGTPSVSPKATFVVLDSSSIAFGNIRSPGTLANIRKRPAVEVCFIDVVLRKAVRVTGSAAIHMKRSRRASFSGVRSDVVGLPGAYVGIREDRHQGRRAHPVSGLRSRVFTRGPAADQS